MIKVFSNNKTVLHISWTGSRICPASILNNDKGMVM